MDKRQSIVQKRKKTQVNNKRAKSTVAKKSERDHGGRAKLVAQQEGQRGVDSRVGQASSVPPLEQLALKAVDKTLDVRVTRGSRSIEHLAQGIILAALKRGWSSQLRQNETGFVYGAYVYLVQSFYSAMQATVPTLQVAPLWYWNMVQALQPTTAPFKTSYVTYKWNLEDGIQSQIPTPVEIMNGVTVTFGLPDLTVAKVNGFYQITTPVYTADLGEAAIKSLFEYWGSDGMTKMVPYETTSISSDTSSFAALYPEMGSSAGSEGAMATTLYSERVIPCPIFAKFGVYQSGEDYRGWSFAGRSSGTPGYVLPRLAEFKSAKQLANRIPPIFKFFDFDEFFDVLSITLGLALERQADAGSGTLSGSCPLTPQQAQILLRQTMIPLFCNEMAQDLQQDGAQTFTMAPFSVGTNGVSVTALNNPIKLPNLFAENIRACARRTVRLPAGDLDLVPVLARKQSVEQLGNYSYSQGNVYSDGTGEMAIDLTSMSYIDTGTTKYISPNGPPLAKYAEAWNVWITSLGNFLTPLTTPGQAPGPSALNVLTMTRHIKYSDLQAVQGVPPVLTKGNLARVSSKKDLGLEFKYSEKVGQVKPLGTSDQFAKFGVVAVTSTNAPLTPLWKYQRVMILPSYVSVEEAGGGAIPYRQVFQVEPFKISTGALPDDVYLQGCPDQFSLHYQMATLDVRTELSPESEITQDFAEINRMGGGGFLTALAGAFTEDVLGIKGSKAIATAIGNATGF